MRVGLKFGDTAQHSRREITGRNSHGQPIYAWVDRPPITGASLQNPNSVITKVGQALVVITEIVLYVDPEIDVQDADRITVRGKTYTVHKSTNLVSGFTTVQAGISGNYPVNSYTDTVANMATYYMISVP